jgi:RsiW-degrading membrane proteinase PrsW (M82 family)
MDSIAQTTPLIHATKIIVSVLPVIGFLIALRLMDGYKLVRVDTVMVQIMAGVIVAFVAFLVNRQLIPLLDLRSAHYTRYAAPVIEETLKSVYLVYLIRSRRLGFMIDAAICGFALGTGFAIVENAYYLRTCVSLSVLACVLRGFGTAVMHGGATTVFGIISQSMSERYVIPRVWIFLPGLGAAIVFHSLFNHLLVTPVLTVAGLVLVLPLLLMVVFQQSERRVRRWLGAGLDTDTDLLAMIRSGSISDSRIGQYLKTLKESFPPEVVADMLCLLRIHSELAIKAKGTLLMREAGFDVPPDPETEAKLRELDFLEKSIGRTGLLAMAPFLHWRTRDLWELHMLGRKRQRRLGG